MAEFSVSTQSLTAAAALCRMAGEMDSGGFEAMEEEFGKLLGSGVRAVILELSALEDVTSAALGAMVDLGRLLEARGGKLVLAALRPEAVALVGILRLKDVLAVVESADAARKMLAKMP